MRAHILVELAMPGEGGKHIARNDRIYAVGEEGKRVEISSAVVSHRIKSTVGSPRVLVVEVLGFDVAVADPDLEDTA